MTLLLLQRLSLLIDRKLLLTDARNVLVMLLLWLAAEVGSNRLLMVLDARLLLLLMMMAEAAKLIGFVELIHLRISWPAPKPSVKELLDAFVTFGRLLNI